MSAALRRGASSLSMAVVKEDELGCDSICESFEAARRRLRDGMTSSTSESAFASSLLPLSAADGLLSSWSSSNSSLARSVAGLVAAEAFFAGRAFDLDVDAVSTTESSASMCAALSEADTSELVCFELEL